MWLNENLQAQETGDAIFRETESSVKKKRQQASCKEVIGMSQELLPGRTCDKPSQCRSHVCYEKKECQGTGVDKNCQTHDDCDPETYCGTLDFWPFESSCLDYQEATGECKEDYECGVDHYCWYNSAEDVRGYKQK